MDKIKVLVVDDSVIARKYLSRILEESGKIEVIDTANNGEEGLEKIKALKPDVVTMDIEMPKMTGLEVLEHLPKDIHIPIIMVSTLTTDGAEETLRALRLGAIDYISKNDVLSFQKASKEAREMLIEKILSAKGARSLSSRKSLLAQQPKTELEHKLEEAQKSKTASSRHKKLEKMNIKLVAIAASTGGPVSLEKVFSKLPKLNVPVLIVQHMPKTFTGIFANSLNKISVLSVTEAEDKEILKPNVAYLAPGGLQMSVGKNSQGLYTKITSEPKTIYTPNANVMFESVAKELGSSALCVIMTGMGDDGFKGLQEVHKANGTIIAQDKDSCVVWGMPRKPTETGIADFVVPLEKIPEYISKIVLGK
jgi:two-component system chemotaxis response regulator CheB